MSNMIKLDYDKLSLEIIRCSKNVKIWQTSKLLFIFRIK